MGYIRRSPLSRNVQSAPSIPRGPGDTVCSIGVHGHQTYGVAVIEWLTTRAEPRRSVGLMCGLGLVLVGLLAGSFWWVCGGCRCAAEGSSFCAVVARNPPWVLLGGLATLPGIALGWFWRTEERNQEFQNAAEAGRADRFVRYAQMLGPDAVSTLGGIHGLKQLGIEDSKRRDLVRDTLCSFIRSRATRDNEAEAHEHPEADDYPEPPHLAIVTSLEALSALRATGADLRDVDLEHLNARSIALVGAGLAGARLRSAVLPMASLSGADLFGANCRVADLTEADLSGSRLAEADFGYAKLVGANLANADLRRADLSNADIRGANFEGANLEGAKLDRATISGALLSQEQLTSTREGPPQDLEDFRPVKFSAERSVAAPKWFRFWS